MKNTIILIDGENFFKKIDQVLYMDKVNNSKIDKTNIQIKTLLNSILYKYKDISIKEIRFYAAKLSLFPDTLKKSKLLIASQRKLKSNLEKQNINFIVSGKVRGYKTTGKDGKSSVIFKEKGVDVKIAVDMITIACDKEAKNIVLCSSDSDLQPAVKETRKRGVEVIYLGFQVDPNIGLTITTNKSILISNKEIISSLPKI
jgi:uncharacterized LabA/DUF88 family protein